MKHVILYLEDVCGMQIKVIEHQGSYKIFVDGEMKHDFVLLSNVFKMVGDIVKYGKDMYL